MYEKSVVTANAIAFAKSEVLGDGAVKAIAAAIGATPTFAHWEIVRGDFVPAYRLEKKCGEDAVVKAWERLAKRMRDAFGVVKPKSASPSASKKSAAREGKAAKIAGLVALHNTPEKLLQAAEAAMKLGKPEDANLAIDAAVGMNKVLAQASQDACKKGWDLVIEACKAARKQGSPELLKNAKRFFNIK